ncbi:DUF1178 family protein [Oceaniovalibus guishaninsula]|nr:DUF1178 family protein [Oceaniovalibus guishaninsula]
MIRYALKCAADHSFDSWFQSGDAFEALLRGGRIACPECGDTGIVKALMAPRVAGDASAAAPPEHPLAALRRRIEREATYVGADFATEARAIHEGERPHRSIYGEARPTALRGLIEDGVPVAPLPFIPKSRTN